MGNIAPAWVTINPSYTLPELILPYSQASGAFNVLPGADVMQRLGEGDLYVYANRIDLRTRMAAGQSAYNELPSVTPVLSQIRTSSYLQRLRAEWDHHDSAAMARRGVPIVEAQRLGAHQGHFQLARGALLYGFNPAAGEGLLNAQGATAINLPPDSNGMTTVVTYDNGQMAFFLQGQVASLKTRTNQLGIGRKFAILGPQRTLGSFEYNVVQLTQFQRGGAGTTSTAGVVKEALMTNGDEVLWCYDDTLIGKGSGGSDAVLIVMPEVEKPQGDGFNTNIFASLAPGLDACTMMLSNVAAPIEITTPIAGGAVDTLYEMRLTSGWSIRPEAVTIVSMIYQ
jgi:hypothetical protein